MSASLRFIPALHGFRAIAAMEVLFYHWVHLFPGFNRWVAGYHLPGHPWLNLTWPWAMGWEGVPLFFVLSGYLLTSQWHGRALTAPAIGRFYLRRVLRIYPAVWLQIAALIVLGWTVPQLFDPPAWRNVLFSVVLWLNLPPVFAPLLNGVWVTLPVELLFYLCLPLLLALQRRFGLGLAALLVLAITLGWRWAVMTRYAGQDLSSHLAVLDALPGTLATFGAGCAAALLQQRLPARHGRTLLWASIAAFVALQALLVSQLETYWRGGWLLATWNSLLALAIAAIVVAACRGEPGTLQRVLSTRPMLWLGNVSFGIYLWHFPVMQTLLKLFPQAATSIDGSVAVLGATLTLTFALAALSYYAIERPAMALPRPTDRRR